MLQKVLSQTTSKFDMIQVPMLMSHLTFSDFVDFLFVSSGILLKHSILKSCFRQSAQGKTTAWDDGNIMCLSESGLFNWILYQILIFTRSPPFCVFFYPINSFARKFYFLRIQQLQYIQYFQYIQSTLVYFRRLLISRKGFR